MRGIAEGRGLRVVKGKIHAPDNVDAPSSGDISESFKKVDGILQSLSGTLEKLAKFDKDFMPDGRGEYEQIARVKIDNQDV